jgi:hypothetical protein
VPYRIIPADDGGPVTVVFSGRLGGADVAAGFEALLGVPARPGGLDVLYDLRTVEALDVLPDDLPVIYGIMKRVTPHLGQGRAAWLARPDAADVGMIAGLLGRRAPNGSRERRGFTDEARARAWLARRPER